MGMKKVYDGYKAFDYLEARFDYRDFVLTKGPGRASPYFFPLSKDIGGNAVKLLEKVW